jgi:hypothetical protein
MITTSIALGQGLREGNMALLDLARALDLTFFQALTLTKFGFVLGAAVLVILGMTSKVQSTRNLVLNSMTVFAVLLLLVSLNNLIMLGV